MKFKVSKFQEGGAAPAPAQDPNAQPAPGGAPAGAEGAAAEGGDPVTQLVQMAQEALQSSNCESALAVCDGLLQLISQGQDGGGGSPAAEPQGAPVYKRGGKMVRRV